MKSRAVLILTIIFLYAIVIGCSSTLASAVSTATPTEPKPTITPTRTPASISANATNVPSALLVPSPFDISMQFGNGSCGDGTPVWFYTFTIDGTSITQSQTDGLGGAIVITLTGSYDPVTGAFSTSADVGTGIENYDGTILFDGTVVTVSGVYGYTPDGGTTCTLDFEGTATP
jgi:hypothetical protein